MADNSPLVDQKLAVSMFLDSLMREPEEELTMAPLSEAVPFEKPVISTPILTPADIAVDLSSVEEKVIAPEIIPEVVVETPVEITQETVVAESEQIETEIAGGRPEWASAPFQAMLFKVAGLSLAVPLVELNGVVEWTGEVTEMPGHSPFYMGLMTHLDKSIPVVDTARLVLPAEKLGQLAGDDAKTRVKRVVLIDEHRWGLACDEVNEVITLEPDQVRWRTSRTKRAWLAGTVVEHMCALVDGKAFSAMLKDGSHQRN